MVRRVASGREEQPVTATGEVVGQVCFHDREQMRRVRDALDDLAAVLSITAPSDRLPVERMDELLPGLRGAAAQISGRLGHRER